MRLRIIYFFFITGVTLSACKEKGLDRNDAELIIKKAYGLPKEIKWNLISGKVNMARFDLSGYTGEKILEENGFRSNTIVDEYYQQSGSILERDKVTANYQLTEKATPFLIKTESYPTFQNHFLALGEFVIDVSGVRKISKTEYEVEFVLRPRLNELGSLIYPNINLRYMTERHIVAPTGGKKFIYEYDLKKDGQRFTQKILKYDDGWKISSNEAEYINSILSPKEYNPY